jgi:hypothetical protein
MLILHLSIKKLEEQDMAYLEYQTHFSYSVETVFRHVVDLEAAPSWHDVFYQVKQVEAGAIGLGTAWDLHYRVFGKEQILHMWIVDWEEAKRVTFRASSLMSIEPYFSLYFEPSSEGTALRFIAHPLIHPLLMLPVRIAFAIGGKSELDKYFKKLAQQLSDSPSVTPIS